MKTVLITGCSSSYGLETARHFHAHGWNVVATVRTPRKTFYPNPNDYACYRWMSQSPKALPLRLPRRE